MNYWLWKKIIDTISSRIFISNRKYINLIVFFIKELLLLKVPCGVRGIIHPLSSDSWVPADTGSSNPCPHPAISRASVRIHKNNLSSHFSNQRTFYLKSTLRRERDSNPRYRSTRHTHFPGVRLRPLGHLSRISKPARFSGRKLLKKI